jgi:hypothetical protein
MSKPCVCCPRAVSWSMDSSGCLSGDHLCMEASVSSNVFESGGVPLCTRRRKCMHAREAATQLCANRHGRGLLAHLVQLAQVQVQVQPCCVGLPRASAASR